MIGLCIAVAILWFLFWFANKYERRIRVLSKRYERKITIADEHVDSIVDACELIMEVYPDPQSDEYRNAMQLKLNIEKFRQL
jgi:hypothetical protein